MMNYSNEEKAKGTILHAAFLWGTNMKKRVVIAILLSVLVVSAEFKATCQETNQPTIQLPSYPLAFGAFVLRFDSGGSLTIEGKGWPALNGKWKTDRL
jgi:hypothetical protein